MDRQMTGQARDAEEELKQSSREHNRECRGYGQTDDGTSQGRR